jgi:hypothetical protein
MKLLIAILVAVVLGVGIAAVFSVFVMLLWNCLCPDIFGLPPISLMQALGLSILANLLIKPQVSTS